MACWTTLWSLLILWMVQTVTGSVEILEPYHPYFVKVGNTMKIRCVSTNEQLEWTRSTPETGWSNTRIMPKAGDDWTIRSTTEQPSGFVESVLIKKNMRLGDRGNYYCRDFNNVASFSIWVTTLQVYNQNITAVEGQQEITVYCLLTGFDMNPPDMYHEWYFKNEIIPYDSARHIVLLNETEINRLGLIIKNPRKEDTGWYQCRFSLATNISPLDIIDEFYIDASRLPASGSNALHNLNVILLCLLALAASVVGNL